MRFQGTHCSHMQTIVDSGASHNLSADLNNLSIHSEYGGTDEVQIANGIGLPITHTGTSLLRYPSRNFLLSDILCVPSARRNLLSVSKYTRDNNISMEFFPTYFLVKDWNTGEPLVKGACSEGVYHLPSSSFNHSAVASFGVRTSPSN